MMCVYIIAFKKVSVYFIGAVHHYIIISFEVNLDEKCRALLNVFFFVQTVCRYAHKRTF